MIIYICHGGRLKKINRLTFHRPDVHPIYFRLCVVIMAASISVLMEELAAASDPMDSLQRLKTAVYCLSPSGLSVAAAHSNLQPLFALVGSVDGVQDGGGGGGGGMEDGEEEERVEMACAVLERLLGGLDPGKLAALHLTTLQFGLAHPRSSVRLLALKQIGRLMECSKTTDVLREGSSLLPQVIDCIGAESLGIAKQALQNIVCLIKSKEGLEVVFAPRQLKQLHSVMDTNDAVRYRVYELVVRIASSSPIALGHCTRSGLVTQLVGELTSDDVLVRATCAETISGLLKSPHGRQFVLQQGVAERISGLLESALNDPFADLYVPGLVKFFGKLVVADGAQMVCERFPIFLRTVLDTATNHEASSQAVALDTLGVLGKTLEGKLVLHKEGERFLSVLKVMGTIAVEAPTEKRIRCLDAMVSLLHLSEEEQNEDVLMMTESWFSTLANEPMIMLWKISTQPFSDLHCTALRVFTAISDQPWAQRHMANTPGFPEYLTDRSVEPDKMAKELKFELVSIITASRTAANIFGSVTYQRLRVYMREGPYYVQPVTQVAIEGSEVEASWKSSRTNRRHHTT
uniref:26S proteasome non-ATPase regulatory subunit 5 n=1 Tax=Eptatretus burgeri TaxID=7764 RepID=A0A8C4Q704_EPTBU